MKISYISHISHISILLTIMALILGSCASDEPRPSSETTTSTVTIRTRAPQAIASDNELIRTWWMAFVDGSNVVRLVIERPSDRTEPVDYETFNFVLDKGVYTVYAFANIPRNTSGLDFTVGNQAPDLSTATWSTVGVPGDDIPMTGVLRNVVLSGKTGDSFTIEVVRLWAKMCFEFTTNASHPVTVKSISMTPALTGAIKLLPDYGSLGKSPVLPAGTICSQLDRNVDINVGSEAVSETFYLLESTAESHPTGCYPLTFGLEYADGTKSTVSALAYQLAYINRNDFVTIPVLITDWTVSLEVLFYPPIGGYPAVVVRSEDDEFYAEFGSSGLFEIAVDVTDSYTGSKLAPDRFSVSLSVGSGSDIFSQQPVWSNGEMIGELAEGTTGTAVINLDITVTDDAIRQTYKRKLYIIRS